MRVRGLWRLRPRQEVILCNDLCHSRRHCPLAGRRKAAHEECASVLLTAGAVRASGWRRLPWVVIALLMWLFTTRGVAIGALVTTVVAGGKDARQIGGHGRGRR